jgi:hypothetical protein
MDSLNITRVIISFFNDIRMRLCKINGENKFPFKWHFILDEEETLSYAWTDFGPAFVF